MDNGKWETIGAINDPDTSRPRTRPAFLLHRPRVPAICLALLIVLSRRQVEHTTATSKSGQWLYAASSLFSAPIAEQLTLESLSFRKFFES